MDYPSSWTNQETGLKTEIPGGIQGDISIVQRGDSLDRRLSAHHDTWPNFLVHSMLYCLQTETSLPFRENWNEAIYNGEFDQSLEPRESSFCFRMAKYDAERGKPQRLPELQTPSVDELQKMPRSLRVSGIFGDPEITAFPIITPQGLEYFTLLEEKVITPRILLTPEDMPNFVTCLVYQMGVQGVRGHKQFPGIAYSEFPFEAYE